jgi:hypothetical protein
LFVGHVFIRDRVITLLFSFSLDSCKRSITQEFALEKAHVYPGRKQTIAELKQVITKDLQITLPQK